MSVVGGGDGCTDAVAIEEAGNQAAVYDTGEGGVVILGGEAEGSAAPVPVRTDVKAMRVVSAAAVTDGIIAVKMVLNGGLVHVGNSIPFLICLSCAIDYAILNTG